MVVEEIVVSLLELDQKADIYFVRNAEDSLIYLVSQLPKSSTKVCLQLPTAIAKSEIVQGESQNT